MGDLLETNNDWSLPQKKVIDFVLFLYQKTAMDWNLAIKRNCEDLLLTVMELFAMIGLGEDVTVERVSKALYREVLTQLRAAESSARRLIMVAARNIVAEPKPRSAVHPATENSAARKDEARKEGNREPRAKPKTERRPLFKLFEPLLDPDRIFLRRFKKKRRARPPLQIIDVGPDPRIPLFLVFRKAEPPPTPDAKEKSDDGMVDAARLVRRLHALLDALQNIPLQAQRYARWRDTPFEDRRPQRDSILRSGRPPGFRRRPKYEVDRILRECVWLARNFQPQLDSS